MADDILCPTCGHSLAFHQYDGGLCEAPIGGLTSKNICGCPLTLHIYIQNLQTKDDRFDQMEEMYEQCRESLSKAIESLESKLQDEVAVSSAALDSVSKKVEFLELKLKTVRELIDEPMSFSKWFERGYRHTAIKMINVDGIISELEKDME